MEYLLFTYPGCLKCEAIKNYLPGTRLEGKEFNLVQKESKLKIREYLDIVRRDEKGAIIIPTIVIQEDGRAITVLNSREELENWLKSKA